MLATIDWGALAEILYVAPVAALVVAVSYALLLLGTSRVGEARRAGAGGVAAAYAGVAAIGGAGFFGAVAFAIFMILDK